MLKRGGEPPLAISSGSRRPDSPNIHFCTPLIAASERLLLPMLKHGGSIINSKRTLIAVSVLFISV